MEGNQREKGKTVKLDYVELGPACGDCVIAMDYDEYPDDDERAVRIRSGLARISKRLSLAGHLGVSDVPCVICGISVAGERHTVAYLE